MIGIKTVSLHSHLMLELIAFLAVYTFHEVDETKTMLICTLKYKLKMA